MLLWRIYVAGNNSKYLGLHIKCPTMSNFNQIWISSTYFPNIKFHGNPSSGSRGDPCDGRTVARTRRSWYKLFAIMPAFLRKLEMATFTLVASH